MIDKDNKPLFDFWGEERTFKGLKGIHRIRQKEFLINESNRLIHLYNLKGDEIKFQKVFEWSKIELTENEIKALGKHYQKNIKKEDTKKEEKNLKIETNINEFNEKNCHNFKIWACEKIVTEFDEYFVFNKKSIKDLNDYEISFFMSKNGFETWLYKDKGIYNEMYDVWDTPDYSSFENYLNYCLNKFGIENWKKFYKQNSKIDIKKQKEILENIKDEFVKNEKIEKFEKLKKYDELRLKKCFILIKQNYDQKFIMNLDDYQLDTMFQGMSAFINDDEIYNKYIVEYEKIKEFIIKTKKQQKERRN